MKINFVMLLVALALASLVAFSFYTGNKQEHYVWLITMTVGFMAYITLSGVIAAHFDDQEKTDNIRFISVVFFIFILISNLTFSFVTLTLAPYVIVNGLLFLIYILIAYGVVRVLK